MGIQDLQIFLENLKSPPGAVPVDLLRIARTIGQRNLSKRNSKNSPHNNQAGQKLSLVVDGECCLHRLYGGYYSDWACGGQWNRMVQFLSVLIQTIHTNNMEISVFFNGCLEQERMSDWVVLQNQNRQKINQVLKHVYSKGTPPPKVWWSAPVCLRTCLRMALRHLNVSVLCSMDDHHQEVIAYCRENNLDGLLADDGEYAAFDPPRYFSSDQLKLTYKGSLETKEYILSEVAKSLNLTQDRLCLLAALLGNYLLSDTELNEFYVKLGLKQNPARNPIETLINTLADFVKNLPSIENLDTVATQVFGSPNDIRSVKLKQSIQYYLNGTKDGFLRYRPKPIGKKIEESQLLANQGKQTVINKVNEEESLRFASETKESEQESLAAYKEATANRRNTPQILIEPPNKQNQQSNSLLEESDPSLEKSGNSAEDEDTNQKINTTQNSVSSLHNGGVSAAVAANLIISSSSSSSSSSATSPARLTPDVAWNGVQNGKIVNPIANGPASTLPSVPPEVMRTASERHQKGLMSPYIYQILTQGELKLPVLLEDESHKEFPSIHVLYRHVRQMVYAIIFNLHHYQYLSSKTKEKGDGEKINVPDVKIKEWVWSKTNPYLRPEVVRAEPIGWAVPTIQRLWFGSTIDDKRRRLRAFLTCMRSDTPLMLNPGYVPQHLLVMASVLRYIMSFKDKKILRKPELDAFIAQAFSPELMNPAYLQDLQLPLVNGRGVQLASLFMQGVENALLANDACGAPIPWLMCCPWLYFDGKLFHHILARTAVVKNLLELCEHRIEHVIKVERMRKAILEGLDVQFARPPLPPMAAMRLPGMPPPNGAICPSVNHVPPPPPPPPPGVSRGVISRRTIPARGGQLEIAGVVVGQWGANYGTRQVSHLPHHPPRGPPGPPAPSHHPRMVSTQLNSIGMKKFHRGGLPNNFPGGVHHLQHPNIPLHAPRPVFPTRPHRKNQTNNNRKKLNSSSNKKNHQAKDQKNKNANDKKENESSANNVAGKQTEKTGPGIEQGTGDKPSKAKHLDQVVESEPHQGQGDGASTVLPTASTQ